MYPVSLPVMPRQAEGVAQQLTTTFHHHTHTRAYQQCNSELRGGGETPFGQNPQDGTFLCEAPQATTVGCRSGATNSTVPLCLRRAKAITSFPADDTALILQSAMHVTSAVRLMPGAGWP